MTAGCVAASTPNRSPDWQDTYENDDRIGCPVS